MTAADSNGNRQKMPSSLFLRDVNITSIGGLKHMIVPFVGNINVVDQATAPVILGAVGTVLRIRPLSDMMSVIPQDESSVIRAGITANGRNFTVTAKCRSGHNGFVCLPEPAIVNGMEFYRMIHVSPEERSLSVFEKHSNVKPSLKLLSYLEKEKYYTRDEFFALTEGAGETRLFRKFIREFIKNYVPEQLPGSEHLLVSVADNGRFYVEDEKTGETVDDLSKADRILFEFICFLKVNSFWKEFQTIRDMNHMELPLFITINPCTDGKPVFAGDIMKLLCGMGRQTFAVDYNSETRCKE